MLLWTSVSCSKVEGRREYSGESLTTVCVCVVCVLCVCVHVHAHVCVWHVCGVGLCIWCGVVCM